MAAYCMAVFQAFSDGIVGADVFCNLMQEVLDERNNCK